MESLNDKNMREKTILDVPYEELATMGANLMLLRQQIHLQAKDHVPHPYGGDYVDDVNAISHVMGIVQDYRFRFSSGYAAGTKEAQSEEALRQFMSGELSSR